MTEVIMPKMGDGMEEGTLLEWLKKEGDTVKSGEVIGTIQTDKATLELESPTAGKLEGFLIERGATVPVGKPIAIVLKEGEKLPSDWGSGAKSSSEPEPSNGTAVKPEVSAAPAKDEPKASEGRIKASPLARKIAKEKGIDLATLSGSGPGGRIVEKDVLATDATAVPLTIVPGGSDKKVALSKIRQVTAQRTAQSKQEVPHFYVSVEVDLEKVASLRAQFEEDGADKVSVNDFVVRACALALTEMPVVNSTFQGDHILEHGSVNMGMAVALEDGLTLPVIKDAQNLTLKQVSAASRDLAGRARENRLSLAELSGSTFSISNMGMLNVDNFAAIINQPNAGIVAVSTASKRVVVNEDGEIDVRLRMNMTGSFDHRVVDGSVGAKFMNLVRDYLENPTRLLS